MADEFEYDLVRSENKSKLKSNEVKSGIQEDEKDNDNLLTKPSTEDWNTPSTFPSYPSHGVIGASEPAWMDIFYSTRNLQKNPNKHNFKKQKFDFYETYEKNLENCNKTPTPIPGLPNLWQNFNKRQNASDEYTTDPSLPARFKNPHLFQGYGCEKGEHPLFRTTSGQYGQFPPTTHDVPHKYHGLDTTFTMHLTDTGMPRNRSLNIK